MSFEFHHSTNEEKENIADTSSRNELITRCDIFALWFCHSPNSFDVTHNALAGWFTIPFNHHDYLLHFVHMKNHRNTVKHISVFLFIERIILLLRIAFFPHSDDSKHSIFHAREIRTSISSKTNVEEEKHNRDAQNK